MPTERLTAYWQRANLIEALVLLTAAPFLFFPHRFIFLTAVFLLLLAALWIAPLYAYLLLASSAARRSPFLVALVPFLALMIAEGVFFGSEHVADAVQNHFPHATDTSAVGFYLFGPSWRGIDLLSMGAGLAFAGAALAGAVWLRRYRWEL